MKCPYFEKCWPVTHKDPHGMALTCMNSSQESLERCGWYKEYQRLATMKQSINGTG